MRGMLRKVIAAMCFVLPLCCGCSEKIGGEELQRRIVGTWTLASSFEEKQYDAAGNLLLTIPCERDADPMRDMRITDGYIELNGLGQYGYTVNGRELEIAPFGKFKVALQAGRMELTMEGWLDDGQKIFSRSVRHYKRTL